MALTTQCTSKVALCQARAKPLDVAYNVSKVIDGMKTAAMAGVDLLIFSGELYLSDYNPMSESEDSVTNPGPNVVANLKKFAEEKSGASFQKISAAAKENKIAVIYSYPELDRSSGTEKYYISAQLLSKDGVSLMNYRKVNLWTPTESAYTAGKEYYVSEVNGIKLGILLCYDLHFTEAMKYLAMKGAHIVVVLTAISDVDYNIVSQLTVPARALDNEIYVAYVNFPGESYEGQSHLANPQGKTVVCAGSEEAMMVAEISIKNGGLNNTLSD